MTVLDVRDLQVHFFTDAGVVKAVDGVDFSLGEGEVLGLVGESGSGKTVTGFSILRLVDPPGRLVGGQILFKGTDLANLSAGSWTDRSGSTGKRSRTRPRQGCRNCAATGSR